MVGGEGRRERRTDQKAQCPCCCQIADGEAWKTARLRHALSLIDRVTHRVDSSGRRRIGRCYVATFIRISLANGTPPVAGRVGSSSTAVSTKQRAMSLRQTFTSRRQYSPEGRRLRTITASLAKAVGVGRWRHGGPLVAARRIWCDEPTHWKVRCRDCWHGVDAGRERRGRQGSWCDRFQEFARRSREARLRLRKSPGPQSVSTATRVLTPRPDPASRSR